MKKKYVTALLATLIITATATAVPFAIYASTDDEINTIAVENKVAETETAGRSIYVGAKAPLDIREKFLDKLGYKDDKDIDTKDVKLEPVSYTHLPDWKHPILVKPWIIT